MLNLRKAMSSLIGVRKQMTFSLRFLNYEQGQSPDSKTREYFYFIDHQGQLFLDDSKMKNFTSCFKEKDFLVFFFKRIKENTCGKYAHEFPYVSPCGREKNYVRCDDTPIVYTHIIEGSTLSGKSDRLSYGGAGDRMTVTFEPENVCMLPETGRVYHPAPEQYGSIGLIKSSLAIDLSKYFEFESGDEAQPPSHFTWKGTRYTLTNILFDKVKFRRFAKPL
ncbi:upf0598 protein c8orf82-like [Plakobranchus ocellatus]|uniref:Upf0598 protein c8orf82-like n=1 Tax=Plakobranchus ocellatus TaxID=259542 RepID=A0AAV3ZCA7_9GAST|nr:upf0598 protein c8orf82-like [Plakobranchus ocellatus]